MRVESRRGRLAAGAWEQQYAPDLGERTLVAGEKDRPHDVGRSGRDAISQGVGVVAVIMVVVVVVVVEWEVVDCRRWSRDG
jgi:hypothetical protein